MDTTWSSTAENACAQTLSDARIFPRRCRARTFHNATAQPQLTRQVRGSGGARRVIALRKRPSAAWAAEGFRPSCRSLTDRLLLWLPSLVA
jgi:hypothetical protein